MVKNLKLKNTNLILKGFAAFVILLCIFSKNSLALSQNNFLKIKNAPPPGFKKIDNEYLDVDIYYNKNFLISTKALVYGNTITLLNPDEVYRELPAIKPQKEFEIKEKLSKTNKFNTRYSCYPEKKNECNMLETKSMALAYNPSIMTLEIIANSDIFVKTLKKDYLKPQDKSFSQFFKFNAAGYWSENKNDETMGSGYIAPPIYYKSNNNDLYNLTINSKTLFLGYSFNTDLNYINERENPFLNNIYLIKYNEKSNLQMGEFNTTDLRNLNQGNLLGLSLKSSTNRRKNDSTIFSSPLSIYLNYRSTVNLIKDGVIYSTQYYNAGTHNLDTGSLPYGSYNVNIEIIEPNGNIRRETQFFAKNGELPPTNEINYWLEFGAIQNYNGNYNIQNEDDKIFNGYEDDFLFRGGLHKNIFKGVGLGMNTVLNNNISAFEFFSEFFGKYTLLKGSIAFDTDRNYNYNVYTQIGNSKNFLFYVSWFQNFLKDEVIKDDYKYRPISNYSKNGSANLKYYFSQGRNSIGIRGNYYEYSSDYRTYSAGPELEFNINRFKNTNIRLTFSAYKTDRDYQGSVNIYLNFNSKYAQLYHNSTYKAEKERKTENQNFDDKFDSSTAITLQNGGTFNQDARLTFRYDDIQQIETKGLELDYKNDIGRLLGNASTNKYLDQYSLNFSSIFAFNKDNILFGSKEQKDSAIAIKIDGSDKNSLFDVYVNQNKVDYVRGNSTKVLTLNAFDEYTISIQPQDSNQSYIKTFNKNTFTFYPGSINSIKYKAKSTIILIGTLYSKDGNVLKNVGISSKIDETITDENGDFQISIIPGEELKIQDIGEIKIPDNFQESKKIIFANIISN